MKKIILTLMIAFLTAGAVTLFISPVKGEETHTHGDTVITNETDLNTLFTNGGSGYLTGNITLNATAVVAEGKTVTLCLNDCLITGKTGFTGSLIKLSNNSKFTLTDCGSTVRYFTDGDTDGCFETLVSGYDETNKEYGKDFIKTKGGVLYGGNATDSGGAITVLGHPEVVLDNVSLVGNKTALTGGAIYTSGSFTVKNSLIAGNTSDGFGGAILCDGFSVTSSEISFNTAKYYGGGIYTGFTGTSEITDSEFNGNKVVNNDDNQTATGGAVYAINSDLTVKNSKINNNSVYSKLGEVNSAGILANKLTMVSSVITGNSVTSESSSGGILSAHNITLDKCTVSGNKITGINKAENVIYSFSGETIIKDTEITDNTAACQNETGTGAGIFGETTTGKNTRISFEGDIILSGNTKYDVKYFTAIDFSKLKTLKTKDGKDTALRCYYEGFTSIAGHEVEISVPLDKDYSSYVKAVNPDAYILNKKEEDKNHIYMASRILEQPSKTNGYTYKIYTDDISDESIQYQWYKMSGDFLTENDNVITLTNGKWNGIELNGEYMGLKAPNIINFTTSKTTLYIYDIYKKFKGSIKGKTELVEGHPNVYKMTPNEGAIVLNIPGIYLSTELLTPSKAENKTKACLNPEDMGTYYCIFSYGDCTLQSNTVKIEHVHAYTYTVSPDGITVTAKCVDDCPYTGNDLSLTLSVPSSPDYDGKPHSASFGNAKTFCGDTLPVITYKKKTGETYGESSEDAPVKAGTYKASFTVGKGDTLKTVEAEFTIAGEAEPDKFSISIAGDSEVRHTDIKTYTVEYTGDLPEHTDIVWEISGCGYQYIGDNLGTGKIRIFCSDIGTLHINATLVDAFGRPVRNADGTIIEAVKDVNVKAETGNIINIIVIAIKLIIGLFGNFFRL